MQNNYKKRIPSSRLIIGRRPLLEALSEHKDIEKIYLLQSASGEEIAQIRKFAKEQDVSVSIVPQEKLDGLSRSNHQGVIAIAALIHFQPLQEIISATIDKGEVPLLVMVDGITDTRNLGAIARSALCYGVHALIIPISGNASITEDAVKSSAGALEKLPVCKVPSIQQAIDILRLNGIKNIATTLQTESNVTQIDLSVPICFILGSEDKGVSKFVLKNAEELVKIPMTKSFNSLNVSVAAGIILYEAFKHRSS